MGYKCQRGVGLDVLIISHTQPNLYNNYYLARLCKHYDKKDSCFSLYKHPSKIITLVTMDALSHLLHGVQMKISQSSSCNSEFLNWIWSKGPAV
jgi:hypothetical protein